MIEKQTPRTREYYTVQELMLQRHQELAVQGESMKEILQMGECCSYIS